MNRGGAAAAARIYFSDESQDMGIITLYWFDWSEKLSSVFFIFRIALFDVDVVSPRG